MKRLTSEEGFPQRYQKINLNAVLIFRSTIVYPTRNDIDLILG